MPPQPPKFRVQLPAFPLPLPVGTDVCSISRIRALLVKRNTGVNFVRRILSPHEPRPSVVDIDHSLSSPLRARTADAALNRAATFLAGRFAAKEAVFKAHAGAQLGFQDVLILPCLNRDGAIKVEMWQRPLVSGGYDKGLWEEPPPSKPRAQETAKSPLSNMRLERHENALRWAQKPEASQAPRDSSPDFLHTTVGTPLQDWISYLDQPVEPKSAAKHETGYSSLETEPTPPPETVEEVPTTERKDYISMPPVAVIRGSSVAQVSISHDGEYAVATCLAYQPGGAPTHWLQGLQSQSQVLDANQGRNLNASQSQIQDASQAQNSGGTDTLKMLEGYVAGQRRFQTTAAWAAAALQQSHQLLQRGKAVVRQVALRRSNPGSPPMRFIRNRDLNPSQLCLISAGSTTSFLRKQTKWQLQRENRTVQRVQRLCTTLCRRGIVILRDGSELVREVKKRRGIPLFSSRYLGATSTRYARH